MFFDEVLILLGFFDHLLTNGIIGGGVKIKIKNN